MTKIAYETDYYTLVGHVDAAVLLTQLVYWQERMGDRWFYKTAEDWYQSTGIKRRRQEAIRKQLMALNILSTKLSGVPARIYYWIDLLLLQKMVAELPVKLDVQSLPIKITGSASHGMDKSCEKNKTDESNQAVDHTDVQTSLDPVCEQVNADSVNQFGSPIQPSLDPTSKQDGTLCTNKDTIHVQTSSAFNVNDLTHCTNQFGSSVQTSLDPASEQDWTLCTNKLGSPVQTITKNKHKITHKTTQESNTKTFVELSENLQTNSDEQNSTDGQLTATEHPPCQPDDVGNSPPAARRGDEAPECLKQPNQQTSQPSCEQAQPENSPNRDQLTSRRSTVAAEELGKMRKILGMPPSLNATSTQKATKKPSEPTAKPTTGVNHSTHTNAKPLAHWMTHIAQTLGSSNHPPAVDSDILEDGLAVEEDTATAVIKSDTVPDDAHVAITGEIIPCTDNTISLNGNSDALAKSPDKPPNAVGEIFNHWQTVMHHPKAKLDDKRKRLIQKAFKMGYTPQELKQAIDGCGQTPHNLGDNDRGQRFDGLHIILRDADQIDRFMLNAVNPPRKLNAQEQLEIDNKRITDEYLRSQGLTPVGEEEIINHGDL